MITINNVTKSFGNYKAINNINISVPKGTIHGLIGENGAGKTTLIQCLTGIYKPDNGDILIDNSPVYENPSVKSKIGYVADSNSYFNTYRVKQMIEFYKGVYHSFDSERFNELNNIFKLPLDRRISQLSKGMQMRLSLMLNLSIHPQVLILDEPTSGLDAIAKNQVLDLLIDEVSSNRCTIFISSHHLSELEKLCDDITILQQGEVLYQSSIEGIKGKVRKLQMVFKQPVDLSQLNGILHYENIGSIFYIITRDYDDSLMSQLKSMGADIIEEIGMSLEEIFIYTNENGR